jgi:hypothetical protein
MGEFRRGVELGAHEGDAANSFIYRADPSQSTIRQLFVGLGIPREGL